MANVTVTTNAAQIPTGFLPDLIRAIRFQMVLAKTVNTDHQWKKGLGQTIHMNRTVNWGMATKVPGVDIVATSYTIPGSDVMFIDRFEYAALQIEDFAALFLDESIIKDMRESMAYTLERGIETTISNQFASFSQTVPGTALSSEVSWGHLSTAARMLQVAGIDQDGADSGKVFLAISSMEEEYLKAQNILASVDYSGQDGVNNITRATLKQTRLLGAQAIRSQLLRAQSATSHDMAMYHRNAISVMIAQAPKYVEQVRALPLGKLCVLYQAYGIKRSFRHVETPGSTDLTDNWAVFLPGV